MAFEWKDREQLWRGCGIYHITLAVVDRQPLLGELQDDATVCWSELGRRVAENIEEIHRRYPAIDICAKQLMPDHPHLVLWVKDAIDKSIKEVMRGFMQGCNHITGERVFTPPFIRTLAHKGQLRAMIDYVYANPHRALLKRSLPQYFTLRRETIVSVLLPISLAPSLTPSYSVHTQRISSAPTPYTNSVHTSADNIRQPLSFSSMGNHWLLDWPMRQWVEMSRSASEDQISTRTQQVLRTAAGGAVTITAAISEGERRVARAVREAGFPLVVLLTDGFPQPSSEAERYYKPGGVYFEACAAGRLLLLEPTSATVALPEIQRATQEALRTKAEAKHYTYTPLPINSLRYRFMACNTIGRLIASITDG